MTQEARSAFQNTLKEALNAYYIGWWVRFKRDQLAELPGAETLKAWVENDQTPQVQRFTDFINASKFPTDVRENLFRLYQQLPPRTRSKRPTPETNLPAIVDPASNLKPTRMTFTLPTIATIVTGVDLAGYSKQDAIVRDSQGNLVAFTRYKSGELAYVRKEKNDLVWSSPEVFDRADDNRNMLHVAAAIDSADNIHVIWGGVPEASDATYGLLTDTTWLRRETISTGTFARNIAVDSANHPHVVWTNVDLFHMTHNGQRWLDPKSVSRGFWHPDILIDHNDDVFLFVNSGGFRPQHHVGVYSIDNTHEHWNAPIQISTSQFWSGAAAATMNSQGEMYAAWIGTPTAEGGNDQVFFSRCINGTWQSPFPIGDVNWAASSTGQESPAVSFDANDVFYVVWRGLNSKNRPMIFARALVPENSKTSQSVTGWSPVIALDNRQWSDAWWPSVADGKALHRGIGVDVVWRANKGRDQVINYAHVSYP